MARPRSNVSRKSICRQVGSPPKGTRLIEEETISLNSTFRRFAPNDRRMLPVYALFFLPLLVTTEMTTPTKVEDLANLQTHKSRGTIDWVADRLRNAVNLLVPSAKSCATVEARKRKKLKFNKYVVPLILGFLLIKSILLPIALKALAVLSGKAVVLSLMSLILAAIVGLKKVAQSSGHNYEVVNLPTSKFRRKDMLEFMDYQEENEPYQFYRDRRKKK